MGPTCNNFYLREINPNHDYHALFENIYLYCTTDRFCVLTKRTRESHCLAPVEYAKCLKGSEVMMTVDITHLPWILNLC